MGLSPTGTSILLAAHMGRPSPHRISEVLRQKVLQVSKEIYYAFNDTHFTEKLVEQEEVILRRDTVRKIRREAGILPKRKRRTIRHRNRQERMAQEGWMVLWDGSPHP